MLLTETYARKSDPRTFFEVVADVYSGRQKQSNTMHNIEKNEEGSLMGFWVGLSARMLHVVVVLTSQLVMYDFIKGMLGLPLTGSL